MTIATLPHPAFPLPFTPGAGSVPSAASTYTAYIDGVAVNVKAGSLNVVNQIGQRSTGSIAVWTALGIRWQYGTRVTLYDDAGNLAYAGYIAKDKAYKAGGSRQGTGYLEHDITLMDNSYRADKRRVFKSYLAQTAGYIVKDLWGAYLNAEGVTYTATSIATGPTITEVIWSGTKSVSDALTWLAGQAGYWWQIDLNGVLWFQPYGGVPAPFVMDGTMADSMQAMSVESGNDMYVNKQFTKGGFAEKGSKTNQLHETFHGNSLTRNFTLSYPVNIVYQIKLNGVDVTAQSAAKGGSGASWYYAKGDATIAQDTSQTLLTSGDTLDIYYTGRYPVIASAQNNALIAAQKAREGNGTGLVESCFVNTKVHTLAAAFQIASALLAHYGQDTTVLTFSTRAKGLLAGQMLTVNLPDFALSNAQMLMSAVGIDDQGPEGFNIWYRVTAIGSPIEPAQWQTYWQNLMNQSSDPSDFTDTQDSALALLLSSTVATTWTATCTLTKTTIPRFGNTTIFDNTLIFG